MDAHSQHVIKGVISGYANKKIYLNNVVGFKETSIDSAFTSSLGEFRFTLSAEAHEGMYKIRFIDPMSNTFSRQALNILYNKEDIVFTTRFERLFNEIVFHESTENQLYYNFLLEYTNQYYSLQNLRSRLSQSEPTDEHYPLIIDAYNKAQQDMHDFVESYAQQHHSSLAASLIRSYKPPIINYEDLQGNFVEIVKQDFFESVDFNNTTLLRTDVFPRKIAEYINLHDDRAIEKTKQDSAYMHAIDMVIAESKVNNQVYFFCLDFLVNVFELERNHTVLEYLAEVVGETGIEPGNSEENEIKQHILRHKNLTIGSLVPNYTFYDIIRDREVSLYDIEAENTLILFWSFACNHCAQQMEKLLETYKAYPRDVLEVVAISLDDNPEMIADYLTYHDLDKWVNHIEIKGYQAHIPKQFNLRFTPTVYLLDKDKKISSIPEVEALKEILSK